MILKNVAGQGLYIYAHDTYADAPKTSDAANITGTLSKDGAAPAALNAAHPTEIGGGVYWWPLTQAETNCNALAVASTSTTEGVRIDPVALHTDAGWVVAITAHTDLITAGHVEITNPVGANGALTLDMGYDHKVSLSNAITLEDDGWPVLTGGTCSLKILQATNRMVAFSVAGEVVAPRMIRFEIGAADTSKLAPGTGKYRYQATATLGEVTRLLAEDSVIVR